MNHKPATRAQKASAIVPLALLSAAWTVHIVTPDAPILAAGAASGIAPAGPTVQQVPGVAPDVPATVDTGEQGSTGFSGDARAIVAHAAPADIPSVALAAYQRAESVIDAADPGCHLTWQLIAAIGRVESDHGRSDGNTLDAAGLARPGIFGTRLDGRSHTTRVVDTDGGQYDGDPSFDRAVGPMQFIPSTWTVAGVDADDDGVRDPQDINDASLATAVYLCSGGNDLSTDAGQRIAVYRYNHSARYVDLVLSVMDGYLDGTAFPGADATLAAGYLPPTGPSSTGVAPARGRDHAEPAALETAGARIWRPSGSPASEPPPPADPPPSTPPTVPPAPQPTVPVPTGAPTDPPPTDEPGTCLTIPPAGDPTMPTPTDQVTLPAPTPLPTTGPPDLPTDGTIAVPVDGSTDVPVDPCAPVPTDPADPADPTDPTATADPTAPATTADEPTGD